MPLGTDQRSSNYSQGITPDEQARRGAALKHIDSCQSMALVLSAEFRCEVSAGAVAHLFKKRWSRVSMLAHAIHDNQEILARYGAPPELDFWSQKDLYDIL